MIVKKQKPHNIGEELILPACVEMVATMLDTEAVEQISKVHLRMMNMSVDNQINVIENAQFVLPLDDQ